MDLEQLRRNSIMYPHFGAEYMLLKKMKEIVVEMTGGVLLDIGCGEKPYEKYFKVDKYIGIDIDYGSHPDSKKKVDMYYDGKIIPFENNSLDWILCTQVIEHVNEPSDFIKECNRVLKKGGGILLTTPQTWGLHEEPYDFYRYTKYGLTYLFEKNGFIVSKVLSTTGIWGTVGQRISSTMFYAFGKKNMISKLFVSLFICMPIQVVTMFFDYISGYKGDTLDNIIFAKK